MNWIDSGEFQLKTEGPRRFVYRRRTNGSKNTINIPNSVAFTRPAVKNWLRRTYKTPNRRIPIFSTTAMPPLSTRGMGWARQKTPSPGTKNTPVKFNCSIGRHLYHRASNQNGLVGFHRLNVNNRTNSLNLIPLRKTSIRKGIAKLDAGKQGVVFLASTSKAVPQGSEFVIKVCPTDKAFPKDRQISQIEYKVQKALYNVVPGNIPKSIAPLISCKDFLSPSELMSKSAVVNSEKDYSNQTLMFSEYIPFGPLPYYLEKIIASQRRRLNDDLMKSFIYQILTTLHKIQRKFPGFRHNDLHMDNILVKPGKPYPVAVINDFGFSTLGTTTKNPLINGGNFKESWGIGSKTTQDYDVHLILNEIRKWCEKNAPSAVDGFRNTLLFLNNKIPAGYKNHDDKYTSKGRLKYNINYPNFPSLRAILNSKYFSGKKRLTPTPTPPSKLKLNLNKSAFTNANLTHMDMSPNFRAWALGKRVRKNTPSPSPNKKKSPNVINLTKSPSPNKKKSPNVINLTNSPSPAKKKKKSLSPAKKSPSPAKKSPSPAKKSPSPARKSAGSVNSANSTLGNLIKSANRKLIPPMTLTTRRKLNRIAGRYEQRYTQRELNNARNKAWQSALRLVARRIRAGRAPFSPSPTKPTAKPTILLGTKKLSTGMKKLLKDLGKRKK
jgi:hypothetical protein